jgi:hypothetical protein
VGRRERLGGLESGGGQRDGHQPATEDGHAAPFQLRPTPPSFVTHRRSRPALAAATDLYATRDPRVLPALFAVALRP